jgi:glycosyltransferase involved in cell wall biosynthesis
MSPLVSLIVRTMGRPELARALDGIAAQTHRPLEIVLVDAGDRGIEKPDHGGVPVRVVRNGRLLRAPAANAGLDAARGEWALFLDEDDEIAPTHVAELLDTARRADALVAYSQAKLLAADGRFLRLLGGPYSRESLFRSNYLTINSVLFSRALLAAGCRVDESFAILEDWDFWLQLSARGPFAFSGGATAIHYPESGESGAGSGANVNLERMLAARRRIAEKWPKPLVSAIVLSFGRTDLKRVLDAIAVQSYQPVEIVVVDAGGRGIEIERHGDHPVRTVDKGKLSRAQAANAGLEAATGHWMLVLDEEAGIDRTHIEQLLGAAARAGSHVAYSQTQLVDADGKLVRLMGGPFNREFLARSNYLALHAVLFSRVVVAAGHRFDEARDAHADWDFWLRLAERTPFAFTGLPTAIIRP